MAHIPHSQRSLKEAAGSVLPGGPVRGAVVTRVRGMRTAHSPDLAPMQARPGVSVALGPPVIPPSQDSLCGASVPGHSGSLGAGPALYFPRGPAKSRWP